MKVELPLACGLVVAVNAVAAPSFIAKPGDDLTVVRDRVRAERPKDGSSATVWLEDGVYAFTNCLALGPEDANTIWRARHPGKVTVVGGPLAERAVPLQGCEQGVGSLRESTNLRAINVPDGLRERFAKPVSSGEFPVFSVDGRYMMPARWPNGGKFHFMNKERFVHGDKVNGVATNSVIHPPTDRSRTWNLKDANAYAYGFIFGNCVYACTWKKLIRFDEHGDLEIGRGWGSVGDESRMWFVNIMEELDAPGECCYDAKTGKLLFIPPEGCAVNSLLALGVATDNLVRIDGNDITIEGIRFTAKGGKPVIAVGEAARTRIEGCRFSGLAAHGIHAGGRGTRIRRCDFEDITVSGVWLTGGDFKTAEPADNAVEDCTFVRCATMKTSWATGGVCVKDGYRCRVSHCLFHDFTEQALVVTGVGNVVEYCRIYDATTEFGDCGAIYCGGMWYNYGNVFRFNDIGSAPGECNALYIDDCSSGNEIYGNVLRDAGNFALFVSGGRDNLISNNVIVASGSGIHCDNRGLCWPAYDDPKKLSAQIDRKFGNKTGLIGTEYPRWKAWDDSSKLTFSGYLDNVWVNNVVIDMQNAPTRFQAICKERVDSSRITCADNLYVRTKGPTSTNAVEFWEFGGFRLVDGTPEKPVDLGFVDMPPARHDARRYTFQEGRWKGFIDRPALRALREKGELTVTPYRTGDFNLKPDAKLKELMPQFQPIPFDKIGLYRDEWRTGL